MERARGLSTATAPRIVGGADFRAPNSGAAHSDPAKAIPFPKARHRKMERHERLAPRQCQATQTAAVSRLRYRFAPIHHASDNYCITVCFRHKILFSFHRRFFPALLDCDFPVKTRPVSGDLQGGVRGRGQTSAAIPRTGSAAEVCGSLCLPHQRRQGAGAVPASPATRAVLRRPATWVGSQLSAGRRGCSRRCCSRWTRRSETALVSSLSAWSAVCR